VIRSLCEELGMGCFKNPVLIEIKQDMPGFDRFIGSWLFRGKFNILVDVGPARTASCLIDSLSAEGLDRVDYILITHVHIDHAGGLGDLLDHYPGAIVICHERAVKHLVDPSVLWGGSLKTLGKIAEAYGEPRSVEKRRIIPHTRCDFEDLRIIETPGHAFHHLSFSYAGNLFVGEAAGNYFRIGDMEYLRPATPPRFFFDVCMESLWRLLELKDQPICFAHFGEAPSSHRLLRVAMNQLFLWKGVISKQLQVSSKGEAFIKRCLELLIEEDSNLRAFGNMSQESRAREEFFIANSIRGFLEFLDKDGQGGNRSLENRAKALIFNKQ